jgi:hypothetical protein
LTRQTILNWVTQFRYWSTENTHMVHQKPMHSEKATVWSSRCQNVVEKHARGVTVAESFLKSVSTANAQCSSDQRCMITEGFKPLYPAMCVSLRHLHKCRHGAKFKLSNCFCPTLYNAQFYQPLHSIRFLTRQAWKSSLMMTRTCRNM